MRRGRSLSRAQRRARDAKLARDAQVAQEVADAIKLAAPFSKRPAVFSTDAIGPESTAWTEGNRYPRFLLRTSGYGVRGR